MARDRIVHGGSPCKPWITKMATQENDNIDYKDRSSSDTTNQQLPPAEGAGGRGEALKYPPRLEATFVPTPACWMLAFTSTTIHLFS